MDEQPLTRSIETPVLPFVGRTTLINRLHQHIIDPAEAVAQCYMGRQQTGKTALLRHIDLSFGADIITVYIPLRDTVFTNDEDLLRQLVTQSQAAVLAAGEYNLERIADMPEAGIGAWMTNEFVPTLLRIIRPHRRLVWLFDDVEMLVDAVRQDRLSSGFFDDIHRLLANHSQLSVVVTIDTTRDTDLAHLLPMVNPNTSNRLPHLLLDEVTTLLRVYASRTSDKAAQEVYRQTGGHPALVQQFGIQLAATGALDIDPSHVQRMVKAIYESSLSIFHGLWRILTLNERLVLTALSNLLYDNPLQESGIDAIETWLVETDYPIDTTAITAAVRSLEYHEIVIGTPKNLDIAAQMMQMWLLEYGNLEDVPGKVTPSAAGIVSSNRVWLAIIGLIIGLLIVVAIVTSLNINTGITQTPQPTVTLNSGQ